MKRGKRPRKGKLKPHDSLDGLKELAAEAAEHRGHGLGWQYISTLEALGSCTNCGGLAIVVIRPAGMENVIAGSAINTECPNRQPGATL